MLKLTDLKELYSNTGKHELEQRCDDHDVPDGLDGHKHTLDHVLVRKNKQMLRYNLSCTALDKSGCFIPWTSMHLKPFCSVDGSEGP